METKICVQCGKEKEISKFSKTDTTWNAKNGWTTVERYKNRCKACYGERFRTRLRLDFIKAYGGKCICCGEDDPRFLSLDHVNSDGSAQKKSLNYVEHQIYSLARREGYPKDKYQLLCYNCNCGRARNNGVCPHKDINKEEYIANKERKITHSTRSAMVINKIGLSLGPQIQHQKALEKNNGYSSRREMLRDEVRKAKGKEKRVVRTKEQILTDTLKILLASGAKSEDILKGLS